jgi:hypothetical protein
VKRELWEKRFDKLCQGLWDISEGCSCKFCSQYAGEIGIEKMRKIKSFIASELKRQKKDIVKKVEKYYKTMWSKE